ncbi:MAG: hypothetical protein GF405_03300 [Candidatus Eisenbacteria bacterium]|nr:hypothetical protein [Candidatus Eisenbacteria bacterium]
MRSARCSSDRVVFCILVNDSDEADSAALLIRSLRDFGGRLSGSDVCVLHPPGTKPRSMSDSLGSLEASGPGNLLAVELEADAEVVRYPFGRKTAACAQVESIARGRYRSLVWMAPQCLVVNEPDLLTLDGEVAAAFRAVHIRNIGSPAEAPPDAFWKSVYGLVGADPAAATVRSLVDDREIRPYFNSHLFAVDPGLGLLARWLKLFRTAIGDRSLQQGPCADDLHRIFLHQAILSALVSREPGSDRVIHLPPGYSYPLHFHPGVPRLRRARTLDDCTCPVYEGAFAYPETLNGLVPGDRMKAWLAHFAPPRG